MSLSSSCSLEDFFHDLVKLENSPIKWCSFGYNSKRIAKRDIAVVP